MARLFFITHSEVNVARDDDIRHWRLSSLGRNRMAALSKAPLLSGVHSVWASGETKAIEAADILGQRLGIVPQVEGGLGENDRSATGFLEPDEFECVADAFFARPTESIRRWERAIDAQHRIVGAVDRVLRKSREGDVAIVSHGAVGALLMCHCAGVAISRKHDQPSQGHFWVASLPDLTIVRGWRPFEETSG
jgi:broad specificity phosphatase PhoE